MRRNRPSPSASSVGAKMEATIRAVRRMLVAGVEVGRVGSEAARGVQGSRARLRPAGGQRMTCGFPTRRCRQARRRRVGGDVVSLPTASDIPGGAPSLVAVNAALVRSNGWEVHTGARELTKWDSRNTLEMSHDGAPPH